MKIRTERSEIIRYYVLCSVCKETECEVDEAMGTGKRIGFIECDSCYNKREESYRTERRNELRKQFSHIMGATIVDVTGEWKLDSIVIRDANGVQYKVEIEYDYDSVELVVNELEDEDK